MQMNQSDEFLLDWILSLQSHSPVADSPHYALIEANLPMIIERTNFYIPMFIIEEELTKEKSGYKSLILREFYVHLLSLIKTNTELSRSDQRRLYSEIMSDVILFGRNSSNPLIDYKMHCLPIAAKLFIIGKLIMQVFDNFELVGGVHLGNDMFMNDYYFTGEGFLCTQFGESLNEKANATLEPPKTKEERASRSKRGWKVLARNIDEWKMIVDALQRHDQNRIASQINASMEEAKRLMIPDEAKKWIRCEFNYHLKSILQPKNTTREQLGETIADEDKFHGSNCVKCKYYPTCHVGNCNYTHPRRKCMKRWPCYMGFDCLRIHRICPEDGKCEDLNCIYHHIRSRPVLLRRLHDDPGSRSLRVRWVDAPLSYYQSPALLHVKCPDFARCIGESCPFAHSNRSDDNLPRTLRDACRLFPHCGKGRDCLYLHGWCPDDGMCMNEVCEMDHCKQSHPRMELETMKEFLENAIREKSRRKPKTALALNPARTEMEIKTGNGEIKRRCEYFPHPCKHVNCKKWRPVFECHFMSGGKCDFGGSLLCSLIHPTCQIDAECTSITCHYEHVQSEPVLIKIRKATIEEIRGFKAEIRNWNRNKLI